MLEILRNVLELDSFKDHHHPLYGEFAERYNLLPPLELAIDDPLGDW